MTTIRQQAGLDQCAAMLREARHELLRAHAAVISDSETWHMNSHKLAVLLEALLAECADVDECRRLVNHVLDKPWKWRAEYVCAKCRQLDSVEVKS